MAKILHCFEYKFTITRMEIGYFCAQTNRLLFLREKYLQYNGELCGTSFLPLRSPRVLRGNGSTVLHIVLCWMVLEGFENINQPPGSILPDLNAHIDMVGPQI